MTIYLSVISFLLALLGLLHQQVFSNDVWFNLSQFLHHESLIACCVVAGIALLVGRYLRR